MCQDREDEVRTEVYRLIQSKGRARKRAAGSL